jgi:hypothetical protein
MPKASIFKLRMTVPCNTFYCTKPAKWAIGREDGPISLAALFCDDCIKDIISSAPEELQPKSETLESLMTVQEPVEEKPKATRKGRVNNA